MFIAAIGLVLAGCGSSEQAHNEQDVTFVQEMIPHHKSAIEMAGLAEGRSTNGAVLSLATRIKNGQQPEIDTMNSWLQDWNVAPAAEGHDSHSGDLTALIGLNGEAFDTRFLELMREHHAGAVSMADKEMASGEYPPAKEMAKNISTTQSSEIAEIDGLSKKDSAAPPAHAGH